MDATAVQPSVQDAVPEPGLLEAIKSSPTLPVTPLREDQIQNAVTFLSHPKVAGSTSSAKRAFLKEKGLTDEEIDEGFSRAAKLPPPAAVAPASPVATPAPPPPAPAPAAEPVQQFTWTRAILAVGVVAAGAYGVSNLVTPYVKKWWFGEDSQTHHDDRVVSLLHAMTKKQEDLDSKVSGLTTTMRSLEGGKNNNVDGESQLQKQVSDLKSEVQRLSSALQETSALSQDIHDIKAYLQGSSAANSLGSPEVTSRRRPAPVPATPHSTFSSVDVQPASQPGSVPYSGAMPYSYTPPASASQAAYPLGNGVSGASPNGSVPEASPGITSPQLPHPPDYLTILKMLEQGQTPPGVRTDINDKPTNTDPTPSEAVRRPKPWERQQGQPSTFTPFENSNPPWDDSSSFGTATENAPPLSSSSSAQNDDAAPAVTGDAGAVSKQDVERLRENDVSEANGEVADVKHSG